MLKGFFFRKTILLLFAIVALGLFYNLYGIHWGLPALWYPDEPETIEQIVIPMARHFDPNPHIFHKGSLYYYFLLIALTPFFIVVKLFHLQTWDYEWLVGQVALFSRIVTVCVGAFGVYMIYLIGKRLRNSAAGIITAFLLAVNIAYASYAHFAYMEVPLVVLILTSLYFGLRYLDAFAKRNLYLSAFVGGLAVSTKFNAAIMVLVFLLILHWARLISLSDLHRGRIEAIRRFFSKEFFLSFGLMVFAFLLTTPFAVLDYRTFLSYMVKQAMISKEGYKVFSGSYSWGGNFLLLEKSFGLPMFIVTLSVFLYGFVRWFKTRNAKEALVFFPPLIYFLYVGTWRITAIRYVLPMVPFLILAIVLVDMQKMKNLIQGVVFTVFLFLCGFTAVQSFLAVRCFKNDTRIAAERWIDGNIPKSSKVEMYAYKMYLPRFFRGLDAYRLTPNFVAESVRFVAFKKSDLGKKFLKNVDQESDQLDNRYEFTETALRRRNPDYILLSSFYDDRYLPSIGNMTPVLYPELGRYYEALVGGRAGYITVAVFKNDRMQEFYVNPTISVLKRAQ
jgi:hypothetical protein